LKLATNITNRKGYFVEAKRERSNVAKAAPCEKANKPSKGISCSLIYFITYSNDSSKP
jgi:hypothetical protein